MWGEGGEGVPTCHVARAGQREKCGHVRGRSTDGGNKSVLTVGQGKGGGGSSVEGTRRAGGIGEGSRESAALRKEGRGVRSDAASSTTAFLWPPFPPC